MRPQLSIRAFELLTNEGFSCGRIPAELLLLERHGLIEIRRGPKFWSWGPTQLGFWVGRAWLELKGASHE